MLEEWPGRLGQWLSSVRFHMVAVNVVSSGYMKVWGLNVLGSQNSQTWLTGW